MELNTEILTGPVRAAATLVMLRDAPAGLEVFLIRRHGQSDELGGAYVFPGGKVDAQDAQLDMASHLDEEPQALHAALNEPELDAMSAAGLYVAAMREAFEESGVLYAQGAGAQVAARATALAREGRPFADVLKTLSLRLSASSLVPWVRWITPQKSAVVRKRFDTRFFLAANAPGQQATHDNFEATESVWLPPRAALEQYWQREIELAPPQIMGLVHLMQHATVQSVMQEARGRRPPAIRPESLEVNGEHVLCYPGDEQHSIARRALPGPTRLHFRNGRFEPAAGFEGLFG